MSSKFKAFMQKAVNKLAATPAAHLGDRSEYVGASDVAGCPRKATLSKTSPPPQRPAKEQIVMEMGHAVEDVIDRIFQAGGFTPIREQSLPHPTLPLKAHVDFLAVSKDKVKVIELKSSKAIPAEPYLNWERQLQAQMGLAQLAYPSKEVEGMIVCVDRTTGGFQDFGPYDPDEDVFGYLTEKAEAIWDAVKHGGPVPEPEPSLLCGYCPFREDCPSQEGSDEELPEDIQQAVLAYAAAYDQKKALDRQMESAKAALETYARGGKLRALVGQYLISVSTFEGSLTVDNQKLRQKYPEIFHEVAKPRNGWTRIEVKKK